MAALFSAMVAFAPRRGDFGGGIVRTEWEPNLLTASLAHRKRCSAVEQVAHTAGFFGPRAAEGPDETASSRRSPNERPRQVANNRRSSCSRTIGIGRSSSFGCLMRAVGTLKFPLVDQPVEQLLKTPISGRRSGCACVFQDGGNEGSICSRAILSTFVGMPVAVRNASSCSAASR
jgi:hypothetical protein